MTTIANLSKEILLLIFEQLEEEDLEQCQYVCHTWYPPAHRVSLYYVNLIGQSSVEHFIACIDMNPNPYYLTAVKSIYFCSGEERPPLGKENIKKLFFRFPNLNYVGFDGAFFVVEGFDDEIIDIFLNDCPKLETFEFGESNTNYSEEEYQRYLHLLDKVRRIQTTINIDEIKEVEDMVPFLADFPRLKAITDTLGRIGTLEKWLPLLDKTPTSTTLKIKLTDDDEVGFAEKYLMTKPREQQHRFIKQLSQIDALYLDCDHAGNFLNSLQFVAKYFTGLTTISIECMLYENAHNIQQLLTISTILDLPVNKSKSLKMRTQKDNFTYILPLIANKVFHQTASTINTPNRILHLCIYESKLPYIQLNSHQSPSEQRLMIGTSFGHHLMFGNSFQLNNVDEFKFETSTQHGGIDVNFYCSIIEPFTSLKKVNFGVPANFQNQPYEHHKSHKTFPLMQEATLRANPDSACQPLLDRCSSAFPNLQRLNLHQFSGIWKQHIGEFQVELGNYTLECLTVDVTPVRNKYLKDDFFVVEVEALQSNKRQLYKVQIDLSLATLIDDSDVNRLVCGENYCKLHITIKSLQNLQLVLDNRTGEYYKKSTLDLAHVSRINLFDKVSS